MSNHLEWGTATGGCYHLVTREAAAKEWNLAEDDLHSAGATAAHVLGLFNENGDGTVLEGDSAEILDFVDLLHAYVHRELDSLIEARLDE